MSLVKKWRESYYVKYGNEHFTVVYGDCDLHSLSRLLLHAFTCGHSFVAGGEGGCCQRMQKGRNRPRIRSYSDYVTVIVSTR